MTTSPENPLSNFRGRCLVRRASLSSGRAGFTLIELIVATILFGAVLSTFVPLMKAISRTQRATERQRIALREAHNILQQIAQRSWADLAVDSLNKLELPESAQTVLPQASLEFDVTETVEPFVSKQVLVRIRWLPQPGRPTESVQLVAWFPAREMQP